MNLSFLRYKSYLLYYYFLILSVVKTNYTVGNFLLLDLTMYWFESGSFGNYLEWSDLNGDNRDRWSVSWSNHFLSMAIIGDYIYLADWKQTEK